MRKTAPLIFMLMFLFSLPAQAEVRSNSIGQDRGRFLEDSAYSLVTDGDESTLYHLESPVWKETKTPLEGGFEISTYNFADGITHYRRYQDNRLVAEGTGPETRYYYYDDNGLLEQTMVLLAEQLTEIELYTYDVTTRRLNSILTITAEGNSISYFGDPTGQSWFSYSMDDTFTKVVQLSDTLQIQEVWEGDSLVKSVEVEMLQDGGIRLTTTRRGVTESELYNNEALLVVKTTPFLTSEYRYNDERSLSEVRESTTEGQVRSIRYEDGQVVSESLYLDEMLEKETRYPMDSGKVETLFDHGQPYCDITYALDGKRVLSIRYR